MLYCNNCILPDSRPGIEIQSDGICSACHATRKKKEIDWIKRSEDFKKIIEHAKSKSTGYDCIIPVSGGKDSTWQVIKCLEYGLNPLAFTWKTPARTAIGQANLQNLVNLGVDHIDFQVNPRVEKKFMLKAFERYGAAGIPMHMAIFNIPVRFAVMYQIPLIIWGENSAAEYSGIDDDLQGYMMNSKWFDKFGVTHGTTARDWVDEDLTEKEMTPYFAPKLEELEKSGILSVFMGHFFKWDPEITYDAAKKHGFRESDKPKTGYYSFADIDCNFISIHHFLKWYKFGITRLFDNLSLEIRNGRISRSEAVEIVREKGSHKPVEDIAMYCDFVGISQERFYRICEKFRNHDIWTKCEDKWIIEGFLIDDWDWDQ